MVLLVIGVRESARANAVMVGIKIVAVIFFLATGATFVKPANWSPYAPYGWSGIMAAAAVVFFAYIGFDAVSTTAEEAKNPKRDLPIGIIASLVVCTALYLAVAAVLTGIVPVVEFRSSAAALAGVTVVPPAESVKFLNAPVAYALGVIGQDWAAYLVSAGAVAGITSVLLVMLMSQPRIFFAMSRDGLLPRGVSKVHPKFGTPVHHDDHHLRGRGSGRRRHADSGRRRDDEHRDAVCVRRGLRRRADAPGEAPRSGASVSCAAGAGFPGARHPVVLVPDAQPAGHHLGPLPRVAEHRLRHLLVLRPDAQPARGCRRSGAPQRVAEAGELRRGVRSARAVQRRLHVPAGNC